MPVSATSPALAAYARAIDQAKGAALPSGQEPPTESFGALLERSLTDAIETSEKSEAVAFEALTGQVPLQELVERVNSAEISLQTVVAVRDRLIAAYQEIMRMPI